MRNASRFSLGHYNDEFQVIVWDETTPSTVYLVSSNANSISLRKSLDSGMTYTMVKTIS